MQGLNSKTRQNLAITAVALQDHISQNLPLQNLSLRVPWSKSLINQKSSTEKCARARGQSVWKQHTAEEREYVLDPSPPALTLAQKLGLVEAPPIPLSSEEWSSIKSRSAVEGDSGLPCAICREEFRLQPQVLLSCSHVFHRACLRTFERFSGRKCCPMCRKEQYETRVIHDGAHCYREKCAIRIQAFWRGHVVRKWYGEVRKMVPPKNKLLRRKFFEGKLQELSDSMVQSCNNNVEEFLSDIDRSVAQSRGVFRLFQEQLASEVEEEDWEKIQEKAMQRETRDCPICLTALCVDGPRTGDGSEKPRRALLLSCSHLFHFRCLEAFEDFCLEGRPVCPLCRSLYQKRIV